MKLNEKYGLVLEGGGFRGCYTAGALKWLNDNDIHFPYVVSISAATCYAYNYVNGLDEESKTISIEGVSSPNVFGIKPLFREGSLLGFKYLMNEYFLKGYRKSIDAFRKSDREAEIGLFNMTQGKLEFFGKKDFDDTGIHVKASCVLPLTGRMTEINGQKFLDGGIKHMVPIQHSIDLGHTKNLVIVTKDKSYVRKPNPWILDLLLKLVYHNYPDMLRTLEHRVETYYQEMGQVADLEEQGQAILIRPSRDTGVKRFSGSRRQMQDMYNLGYQDMEDNRQRIMAFLAQDND